MPQSVVVQFKDKYLGDTPPLVKKCLEEGVAPFAISHCGLVERFIPQEPYRSDCGTDSKEDKYQH